MKKFILFALLPFVLAGCSVPLLKKEAQSPKVNENAQVQTQEQVNVTKKTPVTFTISELKPGDKVGDFVFKSKDGDLCEKNCTTNTCGNIIFENESVLSGKLIFNPKSPGDLIFYTNDKTPSLNYITSDKTTKLTLMNRNVIFINDNNFKNQDFSVITKALPDFSNFIDKNKNATSSIAYNKEIKIKFSNFKTELCVDKKEKKNSADFVSIEDANMSSKECVMHSIKFLYPNTWGDCSVSADNVATIRTDYSKYQVDLILDVTKIDEEKYVSARKNSINFSSLLGGEFFEVATGGGSGGMVLLEGKYYSYNATIKSNQLAPEKLDGVWVPESNITNEVITKIVKSATITK